MLVNHHWLAVSPPISLSVISHQGAPLEEGVRHYARSQFQIPVTLAFHCGSFHVKTRILT